MLLSKKRSLSIIYAAIVAVVAIFLSVVSVKAYVLHAFSYESYHPGYSGYTEIFAKTDSSNAAVFYQDGPSGYDLYVQLWGSDGSSADAYNFTTGGTITVQEGHLEEIPNTAYQYYNGGKCNIRLKMHIYGSGTVSGYWSPTTK